MNAPVSEGATTSLYDLGIVLNDVNKIRLAVGIGEGKLPELPKGIKGDPQQCVLARALSNGWHVEVDSSIYLSHPTAFENSFDWQKAEKVLNELGFEAYWEDGRYESLDGWVEDESQLVIELTPQMEQLVADFDSGLIPSLVLED
jgi:hypothetical protein